MSRYTVLIIEDDDVLRASLVQTMEIEDIKVISTASYLQAKRTIRANFPGIILSDVRMPGHDGFDILDLAQRADPDLPVIFLTGEGDVPMALKAMQSGAHDFLEKPCSIDHLLRVLDRAAEHRKLVLRNRAVERQLNQSDRIAQVFPGGSAAARSTRSFLRSAVVSENHVYLYGETGTGRTQCAVLLAQLMAADGPLLQLQEPLEADAFDALPQDEQAAGAVVFLSLQETTQKTRQHLSQVLARRPDCRLVGTGNAPLQEIAQNWNELGKANLLHIREHRIPNLSERMADLPLLFEEQVRHFWTDETPPVIPRKRMAELLQHPFRRNLLDMRDFAQIAANDLKAEQEGRASNKDYAIQMETYEMALISDALRRSKGRVPEAARMLGLARNTLYDRMARLDLKGKDFKSPPKE